MRKKLHWFSLAIFVLVASTMVWAEPLRIKAYITIHEEPRATRGFDEAPKQQVNSLRDLRRYLDGKIEFVHHREQADVVLVVQNPSSYVPTRDVLEIRSVGDTIYVEERKRGSVPIRGIWVLLLVPEQDYKIEFYGNGTFMWRAAARDVGGKIMAWMEQNVDKFEHK